MTGDHLGVGLEGLEGVGERRVASDGALDVPEHSAARRHAGRSDLASAAAMNLCSLRRALAVRPLAPIASPVLDRAMTTSKVIAAC